MYASKYRDVVCNIHELVTHDIRVYMNNVTYMEFKKSVHMYVHYVDASRSYM